MKQKIKAEFFPLQTIQSMAERWGVQRQTVNNWMLRHNDFPSPKEGIIAATARTPSVFSNADMLRYERNRGLSNVEGIENIDSIYPTNQKIVNNECIS